MITFLCSERASYVAGAAWSVDGGTVQVIDLMSDVRRETSSPPGKGVNLMSDARRETVFVLVREWI